MAGTDGSVDVLAERMGAGYVLGADPVPVRVFSARAGGPLSTAQLEQKPPVYFSFYLTCGNTI